MPVSIRPFQPTDLTRMKEITVEAFRGVSIDEAIDQQYGAIAGRDWQWRKTRHIEQDVARSPEGALIAELDGQVVGYITTWIDREAGVGFLVNLAMDATHRGKGIGRRLIEAALDYLRGNGVTHARIETLEQNPVGQNLYPSCGFREVARQIHYCLSLDC